MLKKENLEGGQPGKKRLSKPIIVEKLDNIKVDEIPKMGETPEEIPMDKPKIEFKVKKTPTIKVKKKR